MNFIMLDDRTINQRESSASLAADTSHACQGSQLSNETKQPRVIPAIRVKF